MPDSSLGGPPRNRSSVQALLRWLLPATATLLALCVAIGLLRAASWPLVHDSPLIHYVVFLMDHNWAPYRDILEMNLPGTYLFEWICIHLFGPGAFGMWLWDGLFGLLAVSASLWIVGPSRRFAGLAAGAFTWLLHLADGPANAGQRDWLAAVLLLLAAGCLFHGRRTRRPAWMLGCTALCGFAATIKPAALLFALGFFAAASWPCSTSIQPHSRRTLSLIAWSALGLTIPAASVLLFLLHWQIIQDFNAALHGLIPYYATLERASLGSLLHSSATDIPLPLTLTLAALFIMARAWQRWETATLALATLLGSLFYISELKIWGYHLYPQIAFYSLLTFVLFSDALTLPASAPLRTGRRTVAALGLLFVILEIAPTRLHTTLAATYPMQTIQALQADIQALGGADLSTRIQCLDVTMGGCINVLDRLRLLPATGAIYDFYLFPPSPTPVTQQLQKKVLTALEARPPALIVLAGGPDPRHGYAQLDRWPAFVDLLRQHYRLFREFPDPRTGSAGYRLYQLTP